MWFYAAAGSGVSVNVGRTKALPFVDGRRGLGTDDEIRDMLRAEELDSVQFWHRDHSAPDEPRYEIAFNTAGGALAAGWSEWDALNASFPLIKCGREPYLFDCPREDHPPLRYLADCGAGREELAVATQANIKWTEDGVERDAAAELDVLVGDLQQTAETAADVYHQKFYGEAIPDPDCLPDLYEPNGTWEAALSRPLSYTADGSPVRVEDLNLCDGATADESDWYAFPSSLINFQTQARIRKPEGSPEGTDVPICMEIWFYDELLELGYLDPVQIASACGTVREEFSTAQLSVASTTGVRWQYLMVHVFPDPSAPAPTEGVDYILTFSE